MASSLASQALHQYIFWQQLISDKNDERIATQQSPIKELMLVSKYSSIPQQKINDQ